MAGLGVTPAGGKVRPAGDALTARGIPFLFASGYGQSAVPPDHPEWRVCSKPFRQVEPIGLLFEQVAQGQAPAQRRR